MIFERIKTEGLAHYSYLIGSGNSAAVIDPRRDIQVYLDAACRQGMRIRHILETHRNEDLVSGACQLAEVATAEIWHGPRNDWGYGKVLADGQEIRLGKISIRTIFTPGHTVESVSFAVTDMTTGHSPVMVFTGDTLFIGATGRVDIYGQETIPGQAAALYDSIFQRILPLGDGVLLYPAHGAGSICGNRIAERDESTVGLERQQNAALQRTHLEEFVEYKRAERPELPPYFSQMEKYNLNGPPLLKGLPQPLALIAADFQTEIDRGAVVIDTRAPASFSGAHIPGSLSIWLAGLAPFAGWVISYDRPVLLVVEDYTHLETAVRHLIRVGYDRIAGFLKDGIEGWYNAGRPITNLPLLSVQQLKDKIDRREDLTVLDVRDTAEWESGHINGATHIYVGHIGERLKEVPTARPVAAVCSVGNRASLAASILHKAGYPQVYNVAGGMSAWRQAGLPVTNNRES